MYKPLHVHSNVVRRAASDAGNNKQEAQLKRSLSDNRHTQIAQGKFKILPDNRSSSTVNEASPKGGETIQRYVNVYPNPTEDILNIRLEDMNMFSFEAFIFDIDGRRLKNKMSTGDFI